MLGRFGWKAGQPTLAQQSSSALAGDIGVSNQLAPVPLGRVQRGAGRVPGGPGRQ